MNFQNLIKKLNLDNCNFYNYSILFLICCIAYVSEYSISFNGLMQKFLWMILASIGLIWNLILIKKKENKKYNYVLYFSLVPYLILMVYTIILLLFKGDTLNITTQAISTTIYIIVDLFMVSFLTMYYKEKSISIITYSIILGYILGLIIGIKEIGVSNLIFNITHNIPAYLEEHDIGVAVVPLLLVYFNFFINKKSNLINNFYIKSISLIIILFLCGKRSAYMGLLVGLFITFLIYGFKNNNKKVCYFLLTAGFVSCYIYVWLIHSELLSSILGNTAFTDRLHVWTWFNDQYWFSPTYLGQGFQYVHIYMVSGLGDGMVNAFGYLHNSILQIYIEGGFIVFTTWFFIMLIAIPKYIRQKQSNDMFNFYTILILSTLVIYTVDNVLTYPIYVISLFVSLFSVTLITEKEVR